MKADRHAKILEIIRKNDVYTQEQLGEMLEDAGMKVTQATLSRDIRELALTKAQTAGGKKKYEPGVTDDDLDEKYRTVFREGVVFMDMAQNILVIKTVPGMAMAVAAALDSMKFEEIVGSIAGDDTIMSAVRTVEETSILMKRLWSLF